MSEATETCTQCKRVLPTTAFAKASNKKNGLYSWCRQCVTVSHRRYYLKHKDEEEFKATHRAGTAKYIRDYPERTKAHRIARDNKAKLMKDACEGCGATEQLHMHHPDYSKPREVITLCVPCHEDVHHGVKI